MVNTNTKLNAVLNEDQWLKMKDACGVYRVTVSAFVRGAIQLALKFLDDGLVDEFYQCVDESYKDLRDPKNRDYDVV